MSYSCVITLPSSLNASISAAHRPWHSGKNKTRPQAKRNEQLWRCVEGCGACCKLAKGPSFATPEEIFTDPSDIESEVVGGVISTMTSSTNYMQELTVTNGYSAPFGHNFDSDGMYEERHPILEAISYLCLVSDSYSPYEEDALCGNSISSPYEKDEVYLVASYYERDQLPYNSWRNWDGEYDSCLSGYFDDNSFSYGDDNRLEKAECWLQSDERGASYGSHHDNAESHLSFDDTAWCADESWFGRVGG
ncbi:hypothetical protein GH714_043805 [Hevea brasiliensis]|uniref:Uncharacterized protein n=1 Tax=Hevea brasiliensis TaxID=3981 RepID=A0A6A6K2T6_HEVBR|nr:hypothetical protein GH714_043805 [Hevea brasiliensis]